MSKRYFANLAATLSLIILSAIAVAAQSNEHEAGPIRSSPAYSEVLLRKTELQAEIEAVSGDYMEANPKMLDLRFELAALDRSLERVFGVRPSETGKLTLALGKLIVRKAALETEHARLLRTYNKEHPDVRRAKRRVEIFEASIKEVLK